MPAQAGTRGGLSVYLKSVSGSTKLSPNSMEKDKDGVAEKKLCPHCKTEVDPKASRCPHCQGKIAQWSTTKVAIAVIFGVGVMSTVLSGGSSSSSAPSVTQTSEQLRQQSAEIAAWQKTPAGKLCAKHPGWQREDCDNLITKNVWIGMSVSMLDYLRGAPDRNNVSNYGRGNRHQYCWDGYNPSCFYDNNDDGIIDSYN